MSKYPQLGNGVHYRDVVEPAFMDQPFVVVGAKAKTTGIKLNGVYNPTGALVNGKPAFMRESVRSPDTQVRAQDTGAESRSTETMCWWGEREKYPKGWRWLFGEKSRCDEGGTSAFATSLTLAPHGSPINTTWFCWEGSKMKPHLTMTAQPVVVMAPDAVTTVAPTIKEWFNKLPEGSFGSSKKRWFVLDEASGAISYYTSPSAIAEELKGAIDINDITEAHTDGLKLGISVVFGRTYVLSGAEDLTVQVWAEHINTMCAKRYAKLVRPSTGPGIALDEVPAPTPAPGSSALEATADGMGVVDDEPENIDVGAPVAAAPVDGGGEGGAATEEEETVQPESDPYDSEDDNTEPEPVAEEGSVLGMSPSLAALVQTDCGASATAAQKEVPAGGHQPTPVTEEQAEAEAEAEIEGTPAPASALVPVQPKAKPMVEETKSKTIVADAEQRGKVASPPAAAKKKKAAPPAVEEKAALPSKAVQEESGAAPAATEDETDVEATPAAQPRGETYAEEPKEKKAPPPAAVKTKAALPPATKKKAAPPPPAVKKKATPPAAAKKKAAAPPAKKKAAAPKPE